MPYLFKYNPVLFKILYSYVWSELIILLLLLLLLFSRWYSYISWSNNGDPNHWGFKFQTAMLSVLCDVPSIAVFCTESIEYLPGMTSKFFVKTFVTIPVASYCRYNHTFHVTRCFYCIHKHFHLIFFCFLLCGISLLWHFHIY